jgi:uncharacterized sulfatase
MGTFRDLFLAAGLLTAAVAAGGASSPPNIIFILADDLGYGDLGCYGQTRIRTPRLDRMAAEGIRFTQCYAGSTVCAPSRSVLMQGLHTGHCRVRGNAGRRNPLAQALRPEDVTVANVLRRAGYVTGLIGKWGLGDVGGAEVGLPRRQGFDYFFGYLNQHHAHNYYPTFLWRNEERVPLRNTVPNEDWAGGGKSDNKLEYSHDLIAKEALDFIRRHQNDRFFLYFAVTLPHANNEARDEGMEVPDLGPYRDLDWPAPVKGHAAMLTRLDRDVGRLLDLLEELGLDERTVVFFSSDNGPHREGGNQPEFNDSNGPLRGTKRDLYEGGIRVPMIVRWPGTIPAGKVSDAIWWFPDFLPTAASLAGIEAPPGLDGIDVQRILFGRQLRRKHSALYWEFHERRFQQAVRSGRWKAIRLAPGNPVELYDLRADSAESRNLAGEHPRRAARLARWMDAMRHESPDWPVQWP